MKGKESKRIALLTTIFSLILLVVMTASLFACSKSDSTTNTTTTAPEQTYTLVFTTHEPSTGLYKSDFFQVWIDELEERTNGRVKVEAHYDGELFSPMDAYDGVMSRAVDMAQIVTAWVPGQFPMADVLSFPSYDKVIYRPSQLLWDLYEEFPEFQAEFADVKVLSLAATYYTCAATSSKPIATLEDNQGLKMVTTSMWSSIRGESLGWTPVSLPPNDVYTNIEKGVVDGGLLGTTYSMIDFGWVEPLNYITRVPMSSVTIAIIMNRDTWNSLPADIQQIIDDMTPWMVELEDEWRIKRDTEFLQSFPGDYGMHFVDVSADELASWNEADVPVKQMFIDELEGMGLPGTELMAKFLELEEKYSAAAYAYK